MDSPLNQLLNKIENLKKTALPQKTSGIKTEREEISELFGENKKNTHLITPTSKTIPSTLVEEAILDKETRHARICGNCHYFFELGGRRGVGLNGLCQHNLVKKNDYTKRAARACDYFLDYEKGMS